MVRTMFQAFLVISAAYQGPRQRKPCHVFPVARRTLPSLEDDRAIGFGEKSSEKALKVRVVTRPGKKNVIYCCLMGLQNVI